MSCTECYMLYGKHQTHCPHYFPREVRELTMDSPDVDIRGIYGQPKRYKIVKNELRLRMVVEAGDNMYDKQMSFDFEDDPTTKAKEKDRHSCSFNELKTE